MKVNTLRLVAVHVCFLFAVSGLGLSQTRGESRRVSGQEAAAGGIRTGGRPAHP